MGGWDWNRPATTSTGVTRPTKNYTQGVTDLNKRTLHHRFTFILLRLKAWYVEYCRTGFKLSYILFCLLMCSGAGFGMGSRSATTSPTGSVHSTPTHSVKPNTLDPFADIGNLGGSFGGQFTTCTLLSSTLVSVQWDFYFLVQVRGSPANPPLLLGQALSCHPWAPHRGLLHPPSILLAFPHGNQVLEVVEDGKAKDKALLHSQNPAPATPPCLTIPPRIDPTTTSASLQWGGARPAQGAKHRLAWVSRRWWIVFDSPAVVVQCVKSI